MRFESFGEVEGFRSQLSVVGVARLSGNSILELLKEKVVSYNLLSVKKGNITIQLVLSICSQNHTSRLLSKFGLL